MRAAALAACLALGVFALPQAWAGHASHDVAAGNLFVSQLPGYDPNNPPGGDDNTNVLVTLGLSVNDFRIGGFNRADYNVQIGPTASDDAPNGILISSIAQNVRANYGTNTFHTPSWVVSSGAYRLTPYGIGGPSTVAAFEDNVNVAAAWFPYATWLGGWCKNSASPTGNTLTNDSMVGSPGLTCWANSPAFTNFYDLKCLSNLAGRSIIDLRNRGIDARKDGILLVTHAKEEANYGLSQVLQSNGTWMVFVKDNRDDGGGSEQDPMGWVFIPKTNTTVVSGHFLTDATGAVTVDIYSGDSPQFTITNIAGGRWMLRMNNPAYTPTNGVLILSPEGNGAYNMDNIVSYEPNAAGDGWELQSRDLPTCGLQSPHAADNSAEPAMGFVYIPANTPGFTVTPTQNLLTTETGGTATFTVVLDRQPYADVTIGVSSSDTTEGAVNVSSLTFTPGNWNVPQTVTITGVDDALADGAIPYTIVLSAATSADPRYNGMVPSSVSVVNADDEPGFTLSKASVTTTEAGGADSFTVVLNTAPAGDVTIGFSSSNTAEGTVAPASLTFTPANWSVPQTVTVTGVDDLVADGNTAYSIITAPATSTDPIYNGLNIADVGAVNRDNDTAGFVFSTTNVVVSESGTSTNITVALTSRPTVNVILHLASSDTTESSVSPASLTFTPANWATPQTFTVAGVDDLVMDGSQSSIVTTVGSGDTVYAALNPTDIAVTTLDNEAALALPSGDAFYGLGDAAVGLDGKATLLDPDTTNYNTGTLTVSITAGANANDRLEIRNTGTAPGQIGVAGATVSFGGTNIGTFTGGAGTTPLVVSFNAASSPAAAQALLRSITYRDVTTNIVKETRSVQVVLADGAGGTSSASKTVQVGMLRIYNFQANVDSGYGLCSNAVDVEIHNSYPDTTYPGGYTGDGVQANRMWIDYANSLNPQVLLGFTNIFGTNSGQIPPGATIVSAQLMLHIVDSGNGMLFHRLLLPWDANTATWSFFDNGVDWNDVEAVSTNATVLGETTQSQLTGAGTVSIGATEDVRIWSAGEQPNYGWMIRPWDFAGNGIAFSPCEDNNPDFRPRLRVLWLPASIPAASFRQNVNGYTGAQDTSIRANAPDTDCSQDTTLFTDWAVSGTSDNEQVLLQFANIIGNAPGQIPAGVMVHAAILDTYSFLGNAVGHGGTFHLMLQPWAATSTWNSFGGGIQADNVKAASAVSASIGNAQRSVMAQATMNPFELTADVQDWVNGTRPNNGWVILPWPDGGDGWAISSAETTTDYLRPQLRVYYSVVPGGTVTIGKLSLLSCRASSVQLGLTATANKSYSVLRAASPAGPWTSIGTMTAGASGTGTYTDSAPLAGKAFYRVSYP